MHSPVLPQPPLPLGVVGGDALQLLPEDKTMAALDQVQQLVGHQALDHAVQ
jgi:hypothetical protein